MGERATREIARRLAAGEPVGALTDVRGTAYAAAHPEVPFPAVDVPSFEDVAASKRDYALATKVEYEEHDPIRGRAIRQAHGDRALVVNPPAMPLSREELDAVAELPYAREVHPMYEPLGGVAAIEEVRFSVTHNRGCFGGCNFCSLAFHQGRMVTSRSHESVIREVEGFTRDPKFKGYVHDVGGPSANFRHPSCRQQTKHGMCKNRSCLAPTPCKNLDPDHGDYLRLLRKLRAIPGVKKVFIRSGIRYDYMLCGDNSEFFADLVRYHISGQLKVAPEHCSARVLDYMGKPHFEVYERFKEKYERLNRRYGLEQYLVPYLMSSHPGCTLSDAVDLAVFLNKTGRQPEQVQDFYPTPGTLSTCMWYTEIDPRTMEPVYVAKSPHDKALQRALLQWKRPELRRLVTEALYKVGREDLIGYGKNCLIRPLHGGPTAGPARDRKEPSPAPAAGGPGGENGRGKGQERRQQPGLPLRGAVRRRETGQEGPPGGQKLPGRQEVSHDLYGTVRLPPGSHHPGGGGRSPHRAVVRRTEVLRRGSARRDPGGGASGVPAGPGLAGPLLPRGGPWPRAAPGPGGDGLPAGGVGRSCGRSPTAGRPPTARWPRRLAAGWGGTPPPGRRGAPWAATPSPF